MQQIVSLLEKSNLFISIDIVELLDEESVKLIKLKATVSDGSLLYITELHTSDYQRYSYHWQKKDGELIIRWDNKYHWKKMKTFPHHKHVSNKVKSSHRITIDEVIEFLKNEIKK